MYRRYMAGVLAAVTGAGSVMMMSTVPAYASTSYEMRRKIVIAADIMDSFDVTKATTSVTREEFAKMLVRASSYNNSVSAYNTVSVFKDVPMDNEYASFIRTATEQGWMTAYLGGSFKPTDPIRLHEAVKAALTLLGYTSEDFTGNQVANRVAKAQSIGLTTSIGKNSTDELNYEDCVNLFYNLMKTNTKANETATKSSSTIYGKLLGFSLTTDNELNMLETLQANLSGPYALKSGRSLSSVIPFGENSASCYLNGAESSVEGIEDAAESETVVVYYNTSTKAVYAYSSDGNSDGTMGTDSGTLDAIYYNSTDVMVPTSIEVNGETYQISSSNSDMQYAFSIYGSLEVGDDITVVWQTDSDGNKTVVSYVG